MVVQESHGLFSLAVAGSWGLGNLEWKKVYISSQFQRPEILAGVLLVAAQLYGKDFI